MKVAIVDYGSGNIRSAAKAFERAAREAGLSPDAVEVVQSAEAVARAERVVVPGVGAFADCRAGILAIEGLWETLNAHVAAGKPLLGICVGMQLIASEGLEHGTWPGFGWIPGKVIAIAGNQHLKVPHMGWNDLSVVRDHPLLAGMTLGSTGQNAYFCHSYHYVTDDPAHVVLRTEYGGRINALVNHRNVAGAQFHPEKSQDLGLRLIANFLRWQP